MDLDSPSGGSAPREPDPASLAGLDAFLDDRCPSRQPQAHCPSLRSVLSLVQRMPAVLWATDRELRFTSLAGSALERSGLQVAGFSGQPVEALFQGGGTGPAPRQAHLRALQGHACSFETEARGRELQGHLEPLRDAAGAVVGVLGVALDLTEHLVVERALRLSELSYRSVIEEAPYAICRCSVDGQLLQVNRAMAGMLGYDPDSEGELLVRDLAEIFVAGCPAFRTALLEGGLVNGMETAWVPRDGIPIQVVVSGRAFRDRTGAVSLFHILAEDVTEKKQLEEQLYQAQKMQAVGQLAGGVAHDFNNLLTMIGGNVEIMLEGTADPLLRRRLSRIQEAADRAAKLTRQLLAYSRRQVLQTRVIDLNQVIGHLLAMLGRLIKANVELSFQADPELAPVSADPHQMEQVLINLTVNAQDAMPEGGRLTIQTRNLRIEPGAPAPADGLGPGDYVQMVVADTGHGMDSETQARVFEPFFTTKKVGEGTGLGLSMAYGIVTQSGGTLRVESEPGGGSTFRITLPRAAGVPAPQPALAAAAHPRGSETILLAEDEPAVRELLEAFLRHLGYTVLAAADGLDALAMALAHPGRIHLLLTDLVMPRCGGLELADKLKKVAPQAQVVFLSGYAGHAAGHDLAFPGQRFLPKPLVLEQLARTLREALA